jgi:hypothetical protein
VRSVYFKEALNEHPLAPRLTIIPILTATRLARICSATVKHGEAVSAAYTMVDPAFHLFYAIVISSCSRVSGLSAACFPLAFLK